MKKMINRKGSTLALTIIIFAVLMIFATFTLGFMVTENKQAMYHQNKTQAYYIARSGAESVEEAIKIDYETIVPRISEVENYPTEVVVSYAGKDIDGNTLTKNVEVFLTKKITKVEEFDIPTEEYLKRIVTNYEVTINSNAIVNGVTEEIEKILEVSITNDYQVSITKPIVYFNDATTTNHIKIEVDEDDGIAVLGNSILFKDFIFGDPEDSNDSSETFFSVPDTASEYKESIIGSSLTGNYKIGNSLVFNSNYTFDGIVNIHVEDYVDIENATFTAVTADSELNFYVYGTNNLNSHILKQGNTEVTYSDLAVLINNDSSNTINANFFIKNGDLFVYGKALVMNGDIMVDGTGNDIYLVSLANSANQFVFNGLIYNKYGSVNFGAEVGSSSIAGAIRLNGLVVGDTVIHDENANHLSKLDFTLVAGINSYLPISSDDTTITPTNDGYYR